MTSMMPQNNPLTIAREAQQMARQAGGCDGQVFQKVAMVSMIAMALASLSQVGLSLLRELDKKERNREEGRSR